MTTESKKVETVEDAMVRAGLPFADVFRMQDSYFRAVPIASAPKDSYGAKITYHWFGYEEQRLVLGTSIRGGAMLQFDFTGENESWVLVIGTKEPEIVTLSF